MQQAKTPRSLNWLNTIRVMLADPVILLVENDELVRTFASECFRDTGLDVVEAANGNDALRVLSSRRDIRAVFTEAFLPGKIDGIEIAYRAREVHSNCVVAVTSGRGLPEREFAGGMHFLHKPYRAEIVAGFLWSEISKRITVD